MKTTHIIGIDEVGRGPLAGPVTLCATCVATDFDLSPSGPFGGIKDSKKLSEKKREEWLVKIGELREKGFINYALISIEADEIDKIGIAVAIKKAVAACLEALIIGAKISPDTVKVFLDGSLSAPEKFIIQETIIKGDEKVPIISAASIVAKVSRDIHMNKMAEKYPGYGLEKHKGYGTAEHIHAIRKNGPSAIHRRSFLKNILTS